MDLPLLEFDPDPVGFVDPNRHRGKADLPEHAVICFFDDIVRGAVGGAKPVYKLRWEHGFHGVWVIEKDDKRITLCHPGCTAPLAAANLDVLVAMGCRKVIVCGGAGTLAPRFEMGAVVVVEDAVRDEGTSYHYLPADAGQLLYCGDDLSKEAWDHRSWDRDAGVRQRLFDLACGACLRL